MKFTASPLQKIQAFGRSFFIKRDDLIHPVINGNKARKMHFLLEMPPDSLHTIFSWGGYQSNAMYALSAIAATREWTFQYYCPKIPARIKQNPGGNLKFALEKGMILHEAARPEFNEIIRSLKTRTSPENTMIIPQGAHCSRAESGVAILAEELIAQATEANITGYDVFLSSGTGTTAFFLSKHLPRNNVFTFPSIGGVDYLREQMKELGEIPPNLKILAPSKNIRFGFTDPEAYAIYREFTDLGLEFDLLYDCPTWLHIKNALNRFSGRDIIFVHSGGIHGNLSQLQRYNYDAGPGG